MSYSHLTPDSAAWLEGQRRAVAMLRELEAAGASQTDYQADFRDGTPQTNIVHGHLSAVIATENENAIAAFSSILTTFLGNTLSGSVPDVNELDESTRFAIPIQMGGVRA